MAFRFRREGQRTLQKIASKKMDLERMGFRNIGDDAKYRMQEWHYQLFMARKARETLHRHEKQLPALQYAHDLRRLGASSKRLAAFTGPGDTHVRSRLPRTVRPVDLEQQQQQQQQQAEAGGGRVFSVGDGSVTVNTAESAGADGARSRLELGGGTFTSSGFSPRRTKYFTWTPLVRNIVPNRRTENPFCSEANNFTGWKEPKALFLDHLDERGIPKTKLADPRPRDGKTQIGGTSDIPGVMPKT